MSGVDVLAVIEGEIADRRREGDTGNVENLIDARAAVAELIEAASTAHMALIGYLPTHRNSVTDAAIAKVVSALDRCQPADMPTELNVDTAAPVAPEVVS